MQEQYFWRQTYDVANTKKFSKLRTICIDNKPQNPDEMILQCANAECRKWQHVKCIAEAAVKQAGKSQCNCFQNFADLEQRTKHQESRN